MKLHYLVLVFSIVTLNINVLTQPFFDARNVSMRFYGPSSLFSSDLDGDGDMDILLGSRSDNTLAWQENLGNKAFAAPQLISNEVLGLSSIYASDLDNDGDMDVVTASKDDHKIAWYENLGSKRFSSQRIITVEAFWAESVFSSDLDNDGDMDVISASESDDKIAWYENLGSGSFSAQKIINSNASDASSVFVFDADNDGDKDILFSSFRGDLVAWHENFGKGSFSAQQTITRSSEGVESIYASDLNGDGDQDIIIVSSEDHKVVWFRNLGNKTFSSEIVIDNGVGATSVHSGDADNDGDMDILVASKSADIVNLYENQGQGTFLKREIANEPNKYFFGSIFADMDEDKDLDVFAIAHSSHEVLLYENNGNNQYSELKRISNSHRWEDSDIGDINGDGDMDVISGSRRGGMVWYENLGNKIFSLENFITTAFIRRLHLTDLNGDGKAEILVGNELDTLQLYENLGNGSFEDPLTLPIAQASVINSGDLDEDGDSDILISSHNHDKLFWLENFGNLSFSAPKIILTDSSSSFYFKLYPTDIDDDGDIDVLSATTNSFNDKISWFENLGNKTFSSENIIAFVKASSLDIGDMDGDGDKDIIAGIKSVIEDELFWFENLGNNVFDSGTMIAKISEHIFSVIVTDGDNDGDEDIFSASHEAIGKSRINWHENTGNKVFANHQGDTLKLSGVITKMIANDYDADGDVDIYFERSPRLAWYDNQRNQASSIKVVQCDSLAYSVPSGDTIYTVPGTYLDTIQSAHGGDSLLTIYLKFGNTTFDTVSIIDCDSYLSPSGMIYDSTGVYVDVIPNGSGCDSIITTNLELNHSSLSSIFAVECDSFTWDQNGMTYFSTGIYTDTLLNQSGCDSLIQLDLTIDTLDLTIINTGSIVRALQSNVSYQWINCTEGGSIIPGATSQSYQVTADGEYAVELIKGGCRDTSQCINVSVVGIKEPVFSKESLVIYPNPSNGKLSINYHVKSFQPNHDLLIYNMNMQLVYQNELKFSVQDIDVKDLANGVYFLRYENIIKKLVIHK